MHFAASSHQAGHQRIFDRGRIGAIIVARYDLRLDAHVMQKRAEPEAERLDAQRLISFSNSQRASYSRKPVGFTIGTVS